MNELIDVTKEELKQVEGGFIIRHCWWQRYCYYNWFLHRWVCHWVRRCWPLPFQSV
jgi:hypothetical protein